MNNIIISDPGDEVESIYLEETQIKNEQSKSTLPKKS